MQRKTESKNEKQERKARTKSKNEKQERKAEQDNLNEHTVETQPLYGLICWMERDRRFETARHMWGKSALQ
jgi:hypothetical protein